jgi:hypothetical protein
VPESGELTGEMGEWGEEDSEEEETSETEWERLRWWMGMGWEWGTLRSLLADMVVVEHRREREKRRDRGVGGMREGERMGEIHRIIWVTDIWSEMD